MSGLRFLLKVPFKAQNIRCYSNGTGLVSLSINEKTGIAKATMNNLPVNSQSTPFLKEMLQTLEEVKKSGSWGLVVTSAGKTTFSAGLNLMEVYNAKEEDFKTYWRLFQELSIQLYKAPFLTVAAINGHAMAGGCVMATTFDYRVMAKSSDPKKPYKMGLNESIIGLAAPIWIQDLFAGIVGPRQAYLGLLKSTLYTSEEALKVGLVDELADSREEVIEKAEKWLLGFQNFPKGALINTKLLNKKAFIDNFHNIRESDVESFAERTLSKESQQILGQYFLAMKKK